MQNFQDACTGPNAWMMVVLILALFIGLVLFYGRDRQG